MMRLAFVLGLLLGLCACSALGIATGAADVLAKANSYASAMIEEKQAKVALWVAISGAIAMLVPILARWLDHRAKKKA